MIRRRLGAEYLNRLFVLLLLVGLLFLLSGLAEFHRRQVNQPDQLGLAELNSQAPFGVNVLIFVRNIGILVIKLLPGVVLNLLPALAALAVIPWMASRFIHTLYETKDVREAHKFLHRNVFGMTAPEPIMIVKEGDIAVGAGSLLDRVGGLGFLIVYNDSAVVLERGGRLIRVVGPSLGFLDRFERVWEVVDLRPQRWILTDNAMTKEGIPIACEADITFKIDDRCVDRWGEVQTKQPVEVDPRSFADMDAAITAELEKAGILEPLPYTDEAVFNAATSIWIRIRQPGHKGRLWKWRGRVVIGEVEGTLRNILARYRLDWLIRPPREGHKHPREEIRELLEQKLHNALPVGNKLGARILGVNLGQIDVKDERISTQWIEAWQAEWERRTVESLAEGEAEMARLQAAQVQAQAEMVLAFTEAIRPLVVSEGTRSSYELATRFVETLWWMSYSPGMRAFLPPGAMRTLKELEKMLGKGEGASQQGDSGQLLPG